MTETCGAPSSLSRFSNQNFRTIEMVSMQASWMILTNCDRMMILTMKEHIVLLLHKGLHVVSAIGLYCVNFAFDIQEYMVVGISTVEEVKNFLESRDASTRIHKLECWLWSA